ncbi:MAG: uracil-DNA glycosylase [Verrucomicrobiales bacterium]|nr:uracil-DNA glycosylase [Verrucomicrobiales bacterium]
MPGFGDEAAELLIVGLAPAAHGANRTGRMFTGDRSGDFLYKHLYLAGFANQPKSLNRQDGLELRNAYITAAARCAPPENKPSAKELERCSGYLKIELELLRPRAVLALGRIAFDALLNMLVRNGAIPSRAGYAFSHGAHFELPGGLPRLFACYHPSQQNTLTGRLTPSMLQSVLRRIHRFLDSGRNQRGC